METLITFVRHGQNNYVEAGTPWHPGPPLNRRGIREANATGKYLSDVSFDMIYSSDMNRARQTAEIINKYQKPQKKNQSFNKLVFIRDLAEHDEIIYEEKPRNKKKFECELAKAQANIKFFKRLLKEHTGNKILIVSHGNAIRAFLGNSFGYSLRKSPELNLFNCAVSTVIYDDSKLKSIFHINFSDHCHPRSFRRKLSSVKFISDYSVLFDGINCKKISSSTKKTKKK